MRYLIYKTIKHDKTNSVIRCIIYFVSRAGVLSGSEREGGRPADVPAERELRINGYASQKRIW
jgi:hypothetical protein